MSGFLRKLLVAPMVALVIATSIVVMVCWATTAAACYLLAEAMGLCSHELDRLTRWADV